MKYWRLLINILIMVKYIKWVNFRKEYALDPNKGVQQILYLKLLKATTQRTDLPIWNLMMKNVYSLDLFGSIQQQDFQLNLLYEVAR